MGFEVNTVWLVAAALCVTAGTLMLVLRRHYSEHMSRALTLWGNSCLCISAAFAFTIGLPRLTLPVAMPLLGVVGMVLQYLAVVELKQQKRQNIWVWGPVLATCAVYVWSGLVRPNMTVALLAFNVIRLITMLRIAASFYQPENGRRQFVDRLAAAVYLLLAISTAGVIVSFLRIPHFQVSYDFNSARSVYNGISIAVAQSILFTLFLLAITERLNFQFKEQATHDALTTLFNRRAIEDIAYHQKALSLRMGQSFSVFMIDVDHFKKINDAYGHAVGDFILKSVAMALRRGLRDEDYLGRWGGDEFCVLLPGTSREQAEIVAERVMGIFETLEITVAEQPITLSISMGAASVNHSVGGFEVLLGMADAALFRAKAKGRGGYLFGDIPSPIPFPSPKKVAAEMRS